MSKGKDLCIPRMTSRRANLSINLVIESFKLRGAPHHFLSILPLHFLAHNRIRQQLTSEIIHILKGGRQPCADLTTLTHAMGYHTTTMICPVGSKTHWEACTLVKAMMKAEIDHFLQRHLRRIDFRMSRHGEIEGLPYLHMESKIVDTIYLSPKMTRQGVKRLSTRAGPCSITLYLQAFHLAFS
jgi:hypothetical protein